MLRGCLSAMLDPPAVTGSDRAGQRHSSCSCNARNRSDTVLITVQTEDQDAGF